MEIWAILLVLVVDILYGGVLLAGLTSSDAGPSLEQPADGTCSLPVIGNSGQVLIACAGVEGKPLRFLDAQLSDVLERQSHGLGDPGRTIDTLGDRLDDLREQAEIWTQRYTELLARLDDSGPARRAHALLLQGEVGPAEAVFEELAARPEDSLERAAGWQNRLGDFAMLRFDPAAALPHYEAAFRAAPDNPLYAAGYARVAYQQRQYAEAERALGTALQDYRTLAAHDPAAYRPALAMTLNNLGLVYRHSGRLAAAERAYAEALAISRDLATGKPKAYAGLVGSLTTRLAELGVTPAAAAR